MRHRTTSSHKPPKRNRTVARQLSRLGRRDPLGGVEILSHFVSAVTVVTAFWRYRDLHREYLISPFRPAGGSNVSEHYCSPMLVIRGDCFRPYPKEMRPAVVNHSEGLKPSGMRLVLVRKENFLDH